MRTWNSDYEHKKAVDKMINLIQHEETNSHETTVAAEQTEQHRDGGAGRKQ